MRTAIVMTGAILLAACQSTTGETPISGPASNTAGLCAARQLQGLLGTPVNQADLTGQDPLRIIPPNSAVTMDYNPERLNIEIDESGTITSVTCG